MIELMIKNYLDKTLSVPAYLEEPRDKPNLYVLIDKTGSSEDNKIKKATVALQSYGESMYEAAKLNEEVKVLLDNIIYFEDISKAKINSDYNFTDTTTKRYRYQAVYDFVY